MVLTGGLSINLLVGDSGTGKTRLLNTIFNFSRQLISEKVLFPGQWDIDFEMNNKTYNYQLDVVDDPNSPGQKIVNKEKLENLSDGKTLVIRSGNKLEWKNETLPKIGKDVSSIYLFREEDDIAPIYYGFKRVIARRFSLDALSSNFNFNFISHDRANKIIEKKNLQALLDDDINFHTRISLLKIIDLKKYEIATGLFKEVFPFIESFEIAPLNKILDTMPVQVNAVSFMIKEKDIASYIPVNDISSGMQKIFLLILDIIILDEDGILLIDEYENSLGINAINYLPELILSITNKCQFIITSHHPYIINSIPIESWFVFHRKGHKISIKSGAEFKEKYGKSKQQKFVQLINDKFYLDGIE